MCGSGSMDKPAPTCHFRVMDRQTTDNKEFSVRAILAGLAPGDAPVAVRGWVCARRDSTAGISPGHRSGGSSFHPLQVVAPATNFLAVPSFA